MSDYTDLAKSPMWIIEVRLVGSATTVVVGDGLTGAPTHEIRFIGTRCNLYYNEMDFFRDTAQRSSRCLARSLTSGNALLEITDGAIVDSVIRPQFSGEPLMSEEGLRGFLVVTGSECLEVFCFDYPEIHAVSPPE